MSSTMCGWYRRWCTAISSLNLASSCAEMRASLCSLSTCSSRQPSHSAAFPQPRTHLDSHRQPAAQARVHLRERPLAQKLAAPDLLHADFWRPAGEVPSALPRGKGRAGKGRVVFGRHGRHLRRERRQRAFSLRCFAPRARACYRRESLLRKQPLRRRTLRGRTHDPHRRCNGVRTAHVRQGVWLGNTWLSCGTLSSWATLRRLREKVLAFLKRLHGEPRR